MGESIYFPNSKNLVLPPASFVTTTNKVISSKSNNVWKVKRIFRLSNTSFHLFTIKNGSSSSVRDRIP